MTNIERLEQIGKDHGIKLSELANTIKNLVDIQKKTGSEVVEIIKNDTGLEMTKEEIHTFIFKHYINPAGDFNYYGRQLWEK